LFTAAAFAIAVNHIASDIAANGFFLEKGGLNESISGLLLVASGAPIYHIWRRARRNA
jgi:hypothetical protein